MTLSADASVQETVQALVKEVKDLRETVQRQEETIDQQAETIDQLETELAQHKDHTGREFADVRGRISEVEETMEEGGTPSSASEPGVEGDGTGPQTPLERIAGYNQAQAFRELTANQERAWFIAKDITEHGKKAMAGYTIDSRTIKSVIGGKEEKRPHDQTVTRIINFLNEFGQDTVRVKKRHGRKLVVIDHDAAERMTAHHARCEAMDGPPTPGSVIPA